LHDCGHNDLRRLNPCEKIFTNLVTDSPFSKDLSSGRMTVKSWRKMFQE
jgi:hypothetical protein